MFTSAQRDASALLDAPKCNTSLLPDAAGYMPIALPHNTMQAHSKLFPQSWTAVEIHPPSPLSSHEKFRPQLFSVVKKKKYHHLS